MPDCWQFRKVLYVDAEHDSEVDTLIFSRFVDVPDGTLADLVLFPFMASGVLTDLSWSL